MEEPVSGNSGKAGGIWSKGRVKGLRLMVHRQGRGLVKESFPRNVGSIVQQTSQDCPSYPIMTVRGSEAKSRNYGGKPHWPVEGIHFWAEE